MKFRVVPFSSTRLPSSETSYSALLSSACMASMIEIGFETEVRMLERVVIKSMGAPAAMSSLRNFPVP